MLDKSRTARRCLPIIGAALIAATLPFAAASAHDPGKDIVLEDGTTAHLHPAGDPHAAMAHHDAATAGVVSSEPSADVIKNVDEAGRGERLSIDSTTDVWALDGYAYTGTFNNPCGGDPEAGVWVWDVHNTIKPEFVGIIASPTGSRSNDVKVANMNSGRILVHSNEACGPGGRGGFEIYNVDNPEAPQLLASVQTDDINIFIRDNFGFTNFGVHNLFLFTQGDRDYVAAVVESLLGNFQIFDITNPSSPALIGSWGAEQLFDNSVDWVNTTDLGAIIAAQDFLNDGFGASQNRFLHDTTITADGMKAYLANWDAGLVLLDISDPTNPALVSVAIDPVNGSLDGEVNSHSVWPSEDGTIVVEGEEDFSAWVTTAPLSNFTFQNLPTNTIPGVGISTDAGTDFENNQVGNNVTVTATSVTVNSGPLAGTVYAAAEGSGNQPRLADLGGSVTGDAVWIGRACNGDPILNAGVFNPGDIAVVRRGACFFSDKLANAAALGASAIVISNNQFSNSPWSGVRVWDYSDPHNPVLASTFDTVCSAAPNPIPGCDPNGTYSSHNVIVESQGGRVKAYVSWYWDGVLVLDVTDPSNPVETARYVRGGPEFTSQNGGPQDVWGIYKEPNSPWIYASDRNGGLYILKEYGSGSSKVAKN